MDATMDLEGLIRSVRRLEDVEAIKSLKYRYLRCVDTGNIDDFRNVLHPDVTIDFVGGSYKFQLQGADAFIAAMRETIHAGVVAEHSAHHPEITVTNDTQASGTWYLLDVFVDNVALIRMYGSLIYDDVYEKVDGRWLIRSSRYRRLYEVVDKMEQPLNLTAHMIGDVLGRHDGQNVDRPVASLFNR